VKSLAEVVQPDGSTRWELVEMDEAAQKKAEPAVEEKPAKRSRKATVEPTSLEPQTTETPEF
jgi:hypothetical protein